MQELQLKEARRKQIIFAELAAAISGKQRRVRAMLCDISLRLASSTDAQRSRHPHNLVNAWFALYLAIASQNFTSLDMLTSLFSVLYLGLLPMECTCTQLWFLEGVASTRTLN